MSFLWQDICDNMFNQCGDLIEIGFRQIQSEANVKAIKARVNNGNARTKQLRRDMEEGASLSKYWLAKRLRLFTTSSSREWNEDSQSENERKVGRYQGTDPACTSKRS